MHTLQAPRFGHANTNQRYAGLSTTSMQTKTECVETLCNVADETRWRKKSNVEKVPFLQCCYTRRFFERGFNWTVLLQFHFTHLSPLCSASITGPNGRAILSKARPSEWMEQLLATPDHIRSRFVDHARTLAGTNADVRSFLTHGMLGVNRGQDVIAKI